tara:strand:- start:247 stop:540 length:294 start_codon:yes stop_codon:yes gene_type:complete
MVKIKLKYTNIVHPDKTFSDVAEFFENGNAGVDDNEALNNHISNDRLYEFSNEKILLDDKKSVVITRTFTNQDMASKWLEERKKLPTIDKNLKEEVI